MSKQIQEQLQIRMKMLDDVFQNVIIALERLEIYQNKNSDSVKDLSQTAMNSDRDLHDDKLNPPTIDGFHLELQLQCMSLFHQTNFDKDKDSFEKVVKYFLNDLLTWYGGRNEKIPYTEIEKYFIPIISSLSRQVSNAGQISEIIKQYVIDIDTDIKNLSNDDKEKAVIEGFTAFTRATEINRKKNETFINSDEGKKTEFNFTSHLRGTAEDGYKRLVFSFIEFYLEKAPIQILNKLVKQHNPDLFNSYTELLEEHIYKTKQKKIKKS